MVVSVVFRFCSDVVDCFVRLCRYLSVLLCLICCSVLLQSMVYLVLFVCSVCLLASDSMYYSLFPTLSVFAF